MYSKVMIGVTCVGGLYLVKGDICIAKLYTKQSKPRGKLDLVFYSLKTVEESLKHVDVRYFLGKCCFVALKVKNPEKRAIFIEQIAQLSQQYKSDVLYGSFETEAESAFLAEQILKSVEIAAGLQKNKSPMFLECCRFPVAGEESAE